MGGILETDCRKLESSMLSEDDSNLGKTQTIEIPVTPGGQLVNTGRRVNLIRPNGKSQDAWTCNIALGAVVDQGNIRPIETASFGQFIADLQWGQGGAEFNAEVDFKRGTQLSVNASSITIAGRLVLPQALVGEFSSYYDRVILSASVTWGSRGPNHDVTRTLGPFTIDQTSPDSFVDIEVPSFAYAFNILDATLDQTFYVLGNATVQQKTGVDTAPVIDTSDGSLFAAAKLSAGVRVGGPVQVLRITNNTLASSNPVPISFYVMFSLAL